MEDISKFSFGADLVVKKPASVWQNCLTRLYTGSMGWFKQVGDIPLEQIRVLDTGAGKFQVDNQCGKKGWRTTWVPG